MKRKRKSNLFLSFIVGGFGIFVGMIGDTGEKIFSGMCKAGVRIIEFSFKYDYL